jgi:hypothetical protein
MGLEGGSAHWWGTKVRQFTGHLRARVSLQERTGLATWLTPDQLKLFEAMHAADQRHGLNVVRSLRDAGVTDRDVLLAGLVHDCGKGRTGVVPRMVYSLGQAYGHRITRVAGIVPGMRADLDRLAAHAATSAEFAADAGCPPRTVELIRNQEEPRDPEFGELLRAADEAN